MSLIDTGDSISVPVGDGVLGRIFNVTGDVVDERGDVKAEKHYGIHRPLRRSPSSPLQRKSSRLASRSST